MTENKRYVQKDRWIKDNFIGKLLNIDFNTITDARLCCDLLNDIENRRAEMGKLATKLLEENEQLRKENQELHKLNQEYINNLSDEKKETLSEMLNIILGDDEE